MRKERPCDSTPFPARRSAWDWLTWGLTNIPLQGELTFAALGDNLIHRQLYDYAFRRWGGDFSGFYEPLRETLAPYDVLAIQQEGLYVEAPEDYQRTNQPLVLSGGGAEEVVVTEEVYPTFRGALVVCQGAGDPAVKLTVTEAVSALTGLGSDRICVVQGQEQR